MKKIILIILMMFVTISLFGECYSKYRKDKRYLFCNENRNWYTANNYCLSQNMKLVTIDNYYENKFINDVIYSFDDFFEKYWIGYNDIITEGTFVWDDGSLSDFTIWNYNEPNNDNDKDCVMMNYSPWKTESCSYSNYFVCEKTINEEDNDDDGVPNQIDNCRFTPNSNQDDDDIDEVGNTCDNCIQIMNPEQIDTDNDTIGDECDSDIDDDDILNENDNCVYVNNGSQTDTDNDSVGDLCDNCPNNYNPEQDDFDNDTLGDACDNCLADSNIYQENIDGDNLGDICDGDSDGDDIPNYKDNCPYIHNNNQSDSDADGTGDICDNCSNIYNPTQSNSDGKFELYSHFGTSGYNEDELGYPFSIAIDSFGYIYLTNTGLHNEYNLYKYDVFGNLITILPFVSTDYVYIDDNDKLYTMNNTDDVITISDLSGNYISNITIDNTINIYTLKVTSSYIYVTTLEKMYKYNLNGELLTSWNLPSNDCYKFEVDSQNNIYVTDVSGQKIIKYDENGNELLQFGSYGTDSGLFSGITGIEIIDNILYITDVEKPRIQKFTLNGEFIEEIRINTMTNPFDILFNKGYLYIINQQKDPNLSNNLMQIYTFADNIGDVCDDDYDNDLILNEDDNCRFIRNNNQEDINTNNLGDVCENIDEDNDGIITLNDNCPYFSNIEQYDMDNDLIGDVCDDDTDGDTFDNDIDNCVEISNITQIDTDKDGLGDSCDDNYCSVNQPFGQCEEKKVCDSGVCVDVVYLCSQNHPDGVCYDGKECIEGNCTDTSSECSTESPTGYCQSGKVCDNGICIDIIYSCSLNHPNGVCEAGKQCVEGNCIDIYNQCSAAYTDGYCEEGKVCDNGICVNILYACSTVHTDGLCQAGYECKEGSCVISDDTNNSSGSDGCSFSAAETRQCLVSTEIIMLFIMMIGLYIKRKSLKTK